MLTDLSLFLPYLLHRAAEQTGAEFQRNYKDKYGMLRTEWRVLFHVGHQPGMSAKDICEFLVRPVIIPEESVGDPIVFSRKPLAVIFDFILQFS